MPMDTEAAREKQITLHTAPLIPSEGLPETLQARKAEMPFYYVELRIENWAWQVNAPPQARSLALEDIF